MGRSWVDSKIRFPRAKVQTRIRKYPRGEDGIVRVRVGGLPEISGYYCDYRGNREAAIAALEHAAAALRELKAGPPEQAAAIAKSGERRPRSASPELPMLKKLTRLETEGGRC